MAKSQICANGFLRINQLILEMVDAFEKDDKERLVKLSRGCIEDFSDFVSILLSEAGVEESEMEQWLATNDEELLREAASAETLRKAKIG